jgi:hypothetical protein
MKFGERMREGEVIEKKYGYYAAITKNMVKSAHSHSHGLAFLLCVNYLFYRQGK